MRVSEEFEARRTARVRRARALSVALSCLVVACGDSEPVDTVPTVVAGEHALRFDETIQWVRGDTMLAELPSDAFQLGLVRELDDRLSYDPHWLEPTGSALDSPPPEDLVWQTAKAIDIIEQSETHARLAIDFESARTTLELRTTRDGSVEADWVPTSVDAGAIAWMRVSLKVEDDDRYYGLGEWMDQVEHRGQRRPMQLEADLRVESANNENHVPVPLLIGTRGWGVFVESKRFGVFDVAQKDPKRVEITYGTAEQSDRGLRFHLYGAERPLDITHHYYQTTVFPKLPARWAYGPLIWRDENRDQAEVEADIRKIRELDLATTAIWIDRPYASHVNSFDFAPADYPDPARMIRTAHDHGLRVSLWHTPYVESAAALHQTVLDEGYFPPVAGLKLNGWSEPIDFTNPEAYAWWQDLIRRYRAMGIEGFKLDYAEDVMSGLAAARSPWRFHDGSDERTMHHGYTVLYHRVYAETLGEDGGFLLCRAGRWGDQAYASVIWPGDLNASFARHKEPIEDGNGLHVGGVPASLIAGLSLGPSGFPFYGADTGGYRGSPPDEETYIRWFQQTALSTVMQVGDSSSQPPWVYTPENGRSDSTLDLYREFARLHLRLFPYVWSYAERLKNDGRPIQRALGLAHPELNAHPNDTYLMGDALLAAPVVTRGQTQREVIFPDGTWHDWFGGESFEGGRHTVAAPLDRLPLFMRAGRVVPMLRPTIDTLSPVTTSTVDSYATRPGRLFVRTSPGPTDRFELYDGSVVSQAESNGGVRLSFESGAEFREGVEFELRHVGRPSAVTQNGGALPERADADALSSAEAGWFYDGRSLFIRFSEGAADVSF